MIAILVGVVVALGILAAVGLLSAANTSLRQARHLELARRLGSGELPPRLLRLREPDAIGRMLGSVGQWLHVLALRAGTDLTAGQVVLVTIAAGSIGLAGFTALMSGPIVFAGIAVAALPILWLQRLAEKRNMLITEQLPDAIDLISRALRSGHAFGEALRMAAAELPSPIGDELAPTAEEHRLGIDLRECLEGLLARMPENFEIRMFASAVLLHRETGGNLVEVLDQLADAVRERVVFEKRAEAMTAEVRTSAVILESLPFAAAFLLSIVAPGYLDPLFQPGPGRTMLAFAIFSMAVGILTMRRIARVEA